MNDQSGVEKGRALQDAFVEIFVSNGGPIGAIMYGKASVVEKENSYWFSPEAAAIDGVLLAGVGAKNCVTPEIQHLAVLVKSSGAAAK